MAIRLQCPVCRVNLLCPDDKAGKQGKCSSCGSSFTVPGGAEAPTPAASSAPAAFSRPATPSTLAAPSRPVTPSAPANLAELSALMKETGAAPRADRNYDVPGLAPNTGGAFAPEKKGISMGVVGGIIMIAIAVVWFVVGYAAGFIFFYPPILAVIGMFAIVKGIATGNVAGERYRR
jgi:hypothetical protein